MWAITNGGTWQRFVQTLGSLITALGLLTASTHAEAPVWGKDMAPVGGVSEEVHPTRILVKFKASFQPRAAKDTTLTRLGVQVHTIGHHTGLSTLNVLGKRQSLKEIIEELQRSGMVEYAEPDYRLSVNTMPNDPRFAALWGLHNPGSAGSNADIDAPEAWEIDTGNPGVVVAVIDSGVDYRHEDLAANMWVNPGEIPGNGIDDDGNGYVDDVYGIDVANADTDPFDDNGHGTHVAGTIGAVGNNRIGVVGVNWHVKLMALKFIDATGSGWTSDAIACLEYAIMMKTRYGVNLKLTSNSWGGERFSRALYDSIEAVGRAGMLFVVAAGNSASNNDTTPVYPASYDLPNIIAVAATTRQDNLAGFSNWGPTSVALGAPGQDILSTVPGNAYATFSGTSVATPHVSGAAALLSAHFPTADLYDIQERLLATVDPTPGLRGRVASEGRLNLYNALTCDAHQPLLIPSLQNGAHVDQGVPLVVTAVLSACARLRGAVVTVGFSSPDASLTLRDDGVAPDRTANDGRYTAQWTPQALGPVRVTFRASHQGTAYAAVVQEEVVPFSGYVYNDTVPFDWVDISRTGSPLRLGDDDYAYVVMPFSVTFYGRRYDHIAISSNGLVYFADDPLGRSYVNLPIPSDTTFANTFIAGWWSDLHPGAGGQIFWAVLGTAPQRRLIIQFDQVAHYATPGAISFEIILYENAEKILMQYLDVDFGSTAYDRGASATVGVQRDRNFGQQYAYNAPALSNGLAILWEQSSPTPLPLSPVTASSYQSPHVPANTRDGNLGTRWSAYGADQWIQYDLGVIGPVHTVSIAWYRGRYRQATFDIAVSLDAEHWSVVYSGTSSRTTRNLEDYTFPTATARYVRIIAHGNTENAWNSITEVAFRSVTASSYQRPHVPTNTRDGNLGTRWTAYGADQWIQYDLGAALSVDTVSIAWYRGRYRRATFGIAVSLDAEHWSAVYSGTSSRRTWDLEDYTFPAATARYVRIIAHGNTENAWNSITEVEIGR